VTQVFDCADLTARPAAISAAARAVGSGQLVVLPTDTVYGIGADAFDSDAVAGLLATKGRGRSMPVPVLVGSWTTIDGLLTYVPDHVRALVEAFWPGGLTLVVEHAPSLSWNLGETRGTVALRMPLHPVALELLAETGPMAVSSANLTGRPAALNVQQAREQFGENVGVYLDGGPSLLGVASTIVDVTRELPRVLRSGAVSIEALREVVPSIVAMSSGSAEGAGS
jgi:tRNA threonylcarbamoyl adenosine modification protein (Sua5/YciO/YrdC/YwlC family)